MKILFIYSRDISLDDSGGARTVIMLMRHLSLKKDVKCYTLFNFDGIQLPNVEIIQREGDLVGQIHSTIVDKGIDILMVPEAVQMCSIASKATLGTSCRIVSALHNMPGYEKMNLHILLLESLLFNDSLIKRFRALICLLFYPLFFLLYVLKEKYNFHIAYVKSDYTVLLSARFYDDFIKEYYIKDLGKKLRAVGNGLSFENFASDIIIESKKKQVLVVSRLAERQKRLSRVFKLWKEVQDLNDSWELIIVGFGRSEELYRRLIKQLKLKRVRMEGRQDPEKYYMESSIFLMTSDFEGWGMTITEAQQCGCVPIALDTYASLKDLVESGKDGLIAKDMSEMKQQLIFLMNNDQKRKKMAKTAVQTCQRFLPDSIYEEYYRIFNEILSNN